MAVSISSSLLACRNAFNKFIEEIELLDEKKPEGLCVQDWDDERGRLRIWAANIGAHQTHQSSLEFRLRDSSHIRNQIIELLRQLRERLQDASVLLKEGEDSDMESLGETSSENESPQTEIQQLRRNVATIINCLFEMSMLTRKPAPHDMRVESRHANTTAYEIYDARHVREKYPQADEILVRRLGRAITKRRRNLEYRKLRAAKLRQGVDRDVADTVQGGSDVLSATVVTSYREWAPDNEMNPSDQASIAGFTQTSYAPTLTSDGHITIPAPPSGSQDGAPFECPYCYYLISINNRSSWNRHVFFDLQPYICTELQCPTPERLYATRHGWTHHHETMHSHEEGGMPHCTLCGATQSTREARYQHVVRHLQELALSVIPRGMEDSDQCSVDGNDSSSSDCSSNAGDEVRDSLDKVRSENSPAMVSTSAGTRDLDAAQRELSTSFSLKSIAGTNDSCQHINNTSVLDSQARGPYGSPAAVFGRCSL